MKRSKRRGEEKREEKTRRDEKELLSAGPYVGVAFDTFYEAYPKHRGRQEAVKAWEKLKPDATLCATIMAAIAAQRQGRQWLEGFIPMPATFLNGRRWEDEVEKSSGASRVMEGNLRAAQAVLERLEERRAAPQGGEA